ncbi:MAG: hypothetical protein FJ027_16250 [Candidatus Rokubacteria bacterium]|nr:hypothetical protein [Candidatus Rokubacteria bacterium]
MLGIGATVVSACGAWAPTEIAEIVAAPAAYDRREVVIRGTVGATIRLPPVGPAWARDVPRRGYVVDDGTAKIIVVTDGAVPTTGESVRVRGTVETWGIEIPTHFQYNVAAYIKER